MDLPLRDLATPRFFLRILGAIYAIAFVSFGVQAMALVGSHGILPAAEFLRAVRAGAGSSAIYELPTLLWLNSSDAAITALWIAGALLSVVAAAGWYYMFYSRAVANLSSIEDQAINRRRLRLRRAGGFIMFLLAIALFAGFHSVDSATSAQAFVLVWLSVFILLLVIVLLAMVDLRLTWHLRNNRRRAAAESQGSRKS